TPGATGVGRGTPRAGRSSEQPNRFWLARWNAEATPTQTQCDPSRRRRRTRGYGARSTGVPFTSTPQPAPATAVVRAASVGAHHAGPTGTGRPSMIPSLRASILGAKGHPSASTTFQKIASWYGNAENGTSLSSS